MKCSSIIFFIYDISFKSPSFFEKKVLERKINKIWT